MELTQRQLGEAFGRSSRQIARWEAEGLAARPEGNRKLYDLAAAIRFFRDREVAAALAGVETGELEAAKLRKLQAEAESKELGVAVKRGELVPMSDVADIVRESLEAVDAVLRHAPSRHAPALAKVAKVSVKESRALLRTVIEGVRAVIREEAEV